MIKSILKTTVIASFFVFLTGENAFGADAEAARPEGGFPARFSRPYCIKESVRVADGTLNDLRQLRKGDECELDLDSFEENQLEGENVFRSISDGSSVYVRRFPKTKTTYIVKGFSEFQLILEEKDYVDSRDRAVEHPWYICLQTGVIFATHPGLRRHMPAGKEPAYAVVKAVITGVAAMDLCSDAEDWAPQS